MEAEMTVTSAGFYVPCGRSNFYEAEKDNDLLQGRMSVRSIQNLLQSSVLKRIYLYCYAHGYRTCYFHYPQDRSKQGYLDESDPIHAVFILDIDQDIFQYTHDLTFKHHRRYYHEGVKQIAFYVSEEGLYHLLVTHEKVVKKEVIFAWLKDYVGFMFGGDHFSHYSGIATQPRTLLEEHPNLRDYQNNIIGLLNIFQLNIILEGLHTYNLDVIVQFGEDVKQRERQKQEYSLRQFGYSVTAHLLLEEIQAIQLMQKFQSWIRDDIVVDEISTLDDFDQSFNFVFNNEIKNDILRRFLRATSISSLRAMKWDVEEARKTLLAETLHSLHRSEPLTQVTAPDNRKVRFVSEANETQLKGFIMLLSGKFPIIRDVERLLSDVIEGMTEKDIEYKNLKSFFKSWTRLVLAIERGTLGIERALTQSRDEKALILAEQRNAMLQTIAEIERIRERRTKRGESPTSFGLTSNIIAYIIFLLTIITLLQTGLGDGIKLGETVNKVQIIYSQFNSIEQNVFLAFIVILSAFGFLALHVLGDFINKLLRRLLTKEPDYRIYEMTLELDLPIEASHAKKIFKGDFHSFAERKWWKLSENVPFWSNVSVHSSRTTRSSSEDGLYNIPIDVDIVWNKQFLQQQKMEGIVTYDIYFHKPSAGHQYVFRKLKFITMSTSALTPIQIDYLFVGIITEFVNCWIPPNGQVRGEDPIFGLSEMSLDVLKSALSVGES